ncbi:hypothetical protein BDR26DRAFT_270352 [Obelidium mucronatum]|nr:hypothetical protein BDR26DRAFT_270352 [Obelidium mucronatum]
MQTPNISGPPPVIPFDDPVYSSKRAEKLLKKLKPFLDEKQKPKSRLAAIYSFLDAILQTSSVTASSNLSSNGPSVDNASSSDSGSDQLILQKFFQDHHTQVLAVLIENLSQQTDKRKDKSTNDRSAPGKDATDFIRIASVLRKLIIYMPEKFENGWESQTFYKAIQSYLCYSNNPKIRTEGFKLFLNWINAQSSRLCFQPEIASHSKITELYMSAINLSIFEAAPLPAPSELARSDCLADDLVPGMDALAAFNGDITELCKPKLSRINFLELDGAPICASNTYPSETDSIDLLEEILSNLSHLALASCTSVVGPTQASTQKSAVRSTSEIDLNWSKLLAQFQWNEADADKLVVNRNAFVSLAVQWDFIKLYYMPVFFPSVCSKFRELKTEGFNQCPTEILQSILLFVSKHILDSSSVGPIDFYPTNTVDPNTLRACKLLQQVILSDVENREIVHEAIRQGLLAPWINSDLGRYSMFILRSWVFSSNDERPPFFKSSGFSLSLKSNLESSPQLPVITEQESSGNIFLRRYIRFVQLLFLDKKDYVEYVDQQMILWREGFQFFRLISLDLCHTTLSEHTWQTLLTTLVEIIDHILCRPNRFAGVASPPDADEICDLAMETLFTIWIRSGTYTDASWSLLNEILCKCARWNQPIVQYVKTVTQLTKIVSVRIFGVDIDQVSKNVIDTKTSQRLRAASITAAKLRNSAGSMSSQSSNKARVYASVSGMTEGLLDNNRKRSLETAVLLENIDAVKQQQPDQANIEIIAPAPEFKPVSKKIEALAKKSEFTNSQAIRDLQKESNTSMNSVHSIEGSHEKLIDRSYSSFSAMYKIPSISPFLQNKLIEFSNLLPLSASWTLDWCFLLWKNMLCVLGDVNRIATPLNHREVINCLVNIFDVFENVRCIQPFGGVLMPPLFDISPWLFKACEISNLDFGDSRELAFGCICRIMCRRHDQMFPLDSLAHFYRIILKGLESEDPIIFTAILTNSTNIFTVLLPGSHMLIPAFIKAIKYMLLTKRKDTNIPEKTIEASIRILFSIVTLPDWKSTDTNVPIPNLKKHVNDSCGYVEKLKSNSRSSLNRSHSDIASYRSASMIDGYSDNHFKLRIQIKDILMELINQEKESLRSKKHSHTHEILIWAIASLTFEEMVSSLSPCTEIIDDGINCMLEHLLFSGFHAVNAAIDSLVFFAKESVILDCVLDLGIIKKVVDKIVIAMSENHILQHIGKEQKCAIISRLIYCLQHWLMIPSTEAVWSQKIAYTVFETLEQVIKDSDEIFDDLPETSINTRQKLQRPDSVHNSNSKDRFIPSNNSIKSEKSSLADELIDVDILKDSTENFILHLSCHYGNFAPPFGPVILCSQVLESVLTEEKSQNELVFFSANDTSLIACSETQDSDTEKIIEKRFKTRVFTRDVTGRHVWECSLFYELASQQIGSIPEPNLLEGDIQENPSCELHVISLQFDGIIQEIPEIPCPTLMKTNFFGASNDQLSSLLLSVGQTYPECLLVSTVPLNQSLDVSQSTLVEVSNIMAATRLQLDQEKESFFETVKVSPSSLQNGLYQRNCSALSLSNTRILLSHIGHLNFDSLKDGYMQQLSKSPPLFRDVKGLDKKFSRETIKVALLYVGPGQEDESCVLRNNAASLEYKELVESLGWEISVSNHSGYLGGLERNQTCGTRARYYCDNVVEIIFHDVLDMPTDVHDPKQVKKKRHIGNDHVHIIWNEHYREYRNNTIGGDFGNAQIIITPMMSDLYKVTVVTDPKVDYFGPLQSHVIISKTSLGPMIRNTAIYAYRGAVFPGYSQKLSSHHPYTHRSNDISTISSRHKTSKCTFENFLNLFVTTEK